MRMVTVALAVAAALVLSARAEAQAVSQIPASGPKPPGAPQTVGFSRGTFRLADRISAKIKNHQPINVVYSYMASGLPLFSQQQLGGFLSGCKTYNAVYPVACSSIAPVQPDANQQVSQTQAKLATGQIDCISILPVTSESTTTIVGQMVARGIPVFTVGVPTHGHEFTNFTQIPLKEGATAAHVVLDWMKANNKSLKVFAVSGGDPAQAWAQGRMKGFRTA